MTWASAWAFALLLPLAALIAWRIWSERRARPAFKFSALTGMKKIEPGWRSRVRWLPSSLYATALVLAIVALARPQESETKIKKNIDGIDIMLTLDISDSMVIEDMRPYKNRMDAAKSVLKDFVQRRVNDRIGFVVFRGEAFTRVPLTLDHKLLIQSIDEVGPTRNIKDGTALGSALAAAVARLKDSTAKSRIVVFATDGESNSGTIDPETALEIAKGYGIKIYAIGIGRDGEAQLPIETIDAFGRKVKRYQPIHSSVNDELLGKFASETGGRYYRATDAKGLEEVFRAIDRLEKSRIDVNEYTSYTELFPVYLKWAIGLLVFALILSQTVLRRAP